MNTRISDSTDEMADEDSERSEVPFTGYRRNDGRIGVRNQVLVLPSVICSHVVAEEIADRSGNAVAASHDHGCGQLGADNEQTEAVLEGVAANPNIAGAVVVGLGCEEVQSNDVAAALDSRGVPVREVVIQEAGGTDACIERGVEAVAELGRHAEEAKSEPGTIAELTVGVVGDLNESSIEHADPLVAQLVNRVVSAGGRVVVAGTERFVAHPEETTSDTVPAAGADIEALVERHGNQPARASSTASRARELSYEACTRVVGDRRIRAVAPYGRSPGIDSGVVLVDAPSRFEEAATALAASGAQIVVHVTGDGIPAGHPIVPVLKISGDTETVAALPDDIDLDATSSTGEDLFRAVRSAIDGSPVSAERHGLTEFAITRVGPSM